eukprot:24818_1
MLRNLSFQTGSFCTVNVQRRFKYFALILVLYGIAMILLFNDDSNKSNINIYSNNNLELKHVKKINADSKCVCNPNTSNLYDSIGNKRKIFVIGLNKCGTSTLQALFECMKYNSWHWMYHRTMIAENIYKAFYENKSLLYYMNDIEAISEMNCAQCKNINQCYPQIEFYKLLHKQYPNSFFILNNRNIKNHIKSINNWSNLKQQINNCNIK